MGRWGWRPLLFSAFASVWVVGCSSLLGGAAVTPTSPFPNVTLTVRQSDAQAPTDPPAVAAMPTPQPTVTPEASPTPIIYTVQEGDTLLEIAFRFGIDLSVLQIANGGLDPLTLQIGQQLIIPDPQRTVSGVPIVPTATPLALQLAAPTCYPTPADSLLCLGRVNNSTDVPLERVVVLVQLLRADGSALLEGDATLEQAFIPAGSAGPYRVLFDSDWEEFAGVVAFLRSADHARRLDQRFVRLVIEDQNSTMSDGRYSITAALRNPSGQDASALRVVAALYTENGDLVGYRIVQADEGLAAGASRPISIEIVPQTTGIALNPVLYAEGRPAQEINVPTPELP